MILKILTYNIHKGFDWNKKNYFLKEIKSLVKESNANLVFLQEVVGKNDQYKKKGLIDSQFEFLADSLWTHYSYAQNAVYDHGHHGNLILSEWPIESWENINISTNVFEKRGLLSCKISLPRSESHQKNQKQKYLYIFCAHLDLLNKGRLIQYKMIKDYIKALKISAHDPLILAGDFNDWNKQATHFLENDLKLTEVHKHQHGIFAKTFPAAFPLLALDRIYVKNVKIVHSYVMPKTQQRHFSDHLPLFCEVQLNET